MSEVASAVPGFLTTKEYRRFEEFCGACRRERYIGICYGPPGVGKTLSARHYAKWDLFEGRNPFAFCEPVPAEAADCCCLLYTPAVTNTPRSVRSGLNDGTMLLETLVDRAHGPLFPESPSSFSARCELVIVDEADRLSTSSIEELRDFYDRSKIGLVLVGMPGLEKRLARYAQFYSRVGFAHAFRPLSQDEARFVLEQHWQGWGGTIRSDEFADQEAVAAVIAITAGNFRLIDRLMGQVRRIKEINQLTTVTREVVDAARDCLVIGSS